MEINKRIAIPILVLTVLAGGTFMGSKLLFGSSQSSSSLSDRVLLNESNTDVFVEDDAEEGVKSKDSIASELGTKAAKFYASNLKLDDLSQIFDYYIPSDMSFILNEYHKANLKSESTLPFSTWSSEAVDNTFMAKTGGKLYDLFLMKVSGETIQYGFVPVNKSLLESGKMTKIMEKYTYE